MRIYLDDNREHTIKDITYISNKWERSYLVRFNDYKDIILSLTSINKEVVLDDNEELRLVN